MGNRREGVDELKALGNQYTKYVFDYNPDVLEKIPNKHDDRDYFVKFNCPEFTSLCPKTGQPDLQQFIFHTFLISILWKVNHLSYICSASEIMGTFTRIVSILS